jgi:hypothetical protein
VDLVRSDPLKQSRARSAGPPGQRQTGARDQLPCRQIARLAPFEDRPGDVGGEIAEADNPSEIGSAHSFAHSKRSKGDVLALDECRVEPMCPDKQLLHPLDKCGVNYLPARQVDGWVGD